MTFHAWLQVLFFIVAFVGLTPLLGKYMADVFMGTRTFLHPVLGWLERFFYWGSGVDPNEEMSWQFYAKSLVLFNFFGFLLIFLLQIAQAHLPLNPQHFVGVDWALAFNTAVSFITNTNWQAYTGESSLSYLTQMMGLGVQNFLSAATGMSVLVAFARGFMRKSTNTIGNFWVDLVRSIVYIFLPLSILFAIVLVGQGVIQTFHPYVELTTLENAKQTIPLGPVASQEAIKQIGTNGGGFFNANSAHPFENPTGFSNFLELLAIILIPAASIYMYGVMINSVKHTWLIYGVMFLLWASGLAIANYSEHLRDPILGAYPILEGQEARLGPINTLLWSVSTTATANGSVNAMLSSLTPLAGGISMFNIMLGELIFGGVGVGLSSMIMFILLTVFLCGLMVGRTPEYLGKKLEKLEIQWVMAAILTPTALILLGAGISIVLPIALSSLGNAGPHGLSEMLYSFSSSAGNNGSAFAGLNANTNYFNIVLGCVMIIARLAIVVPSLAIAGSLANKKITPPSPGTFSTNTFLFVILLLSIILIVGALSFFPALSLGPIVEHFLMLEGVGF